MEKCFINTRFEFQLLFVFASSRYHCNMFRGLYGHPQVRHSVPALWEVSTLVRIQLEYKSFGSRPHATTASFVIKFFFSLWSLWLVFYFYKVFSLKDTAPTEGGEYQSSAPLHPLPRVCGSGGVFKQILGILLILQFVFLSPLWSSDQSSWLQIRRPEFDSRHYQEKK
jgi:hypothetical protein